MKHIEFLHTIIDREETSGYENIFKAWSCLNKTITCEPQINIGLLSPDYIIHLHGLIYPKAKNLCTHQKWTSHNGYTKYYPHFLNEQASLAALQLLSDLNNAGLQKIETHRDLLVCMCKFGFTLSSLHFFCNANGRLNRLLMSYILKRGYKNWLTFECDQEYYVNVLSETQNITPYLQQTIYTEQQSQMEVLNLYNNPCEKLISLMNMQIKNEEKINLF